MTRCPCKVGQQRRPGTEKGLEPQSDAEKPAPLHVQATFLDVCMFSVAQSCLTLCDPMDCSPPGSSVHGILLARTLEWVPCPPPEDLPDPGIKPTSPSSPALAGAFFTDEPPGKPRILWGALKCQCLGFSRISEVRTFGGWAQVSIF